MSLSLTEGSVYELLRRDPSMIFDEHVAHAGLIYDPRARATLERVHRGYAAIAREAGLPLILQTDTWRASRDRVRASGLPETINEDNVAFLREISEGATILGLLGPYGDAYKPSEALSEVEAEEYHSWQAHRLKGADLLMAATLPALSEAMGLARAMGATGRPCILSFVVRESGQLLDGTSLTDAILLIDRLTPEPKMYAINCVHPDTAHVALQNTGVAARSRIKWLQANASRLSPEELDDSPELHTSDPDEWAQAMMRVALEFDLEVIGGCCGTKASHIGALAKLMQP
jgi:homocysteine S-methyltransferase